MANTENNQYLVEALATAFQDKNMADAFLGKLSSTDAAGNPVNGDSIWQQQLDAVDLPLSADVDTENLATLYPLSEAEIGAVVRMLKAEHARNPVEVSPDIIGKAIIIQLGSNLLAGRLEAMRAMAHYPAGEAYACAAAYDNCGARHNCGQPFHCGPDFHCGTPFECGTRFELVPCVSSEIHCAHHDHNIDNPEN